MSIQNQSASIIYCCCILTGWDLCHHYRPTGQGDAIGLNEGSYICCQESIDQNQRKPLKMKNVAKEMDEEEMTAFSLKLNALTRLLDLHPYNEHGQLEGKLQPVSHNLIHQFMFFVPIQCIRKIRKILKVTWIWLSLLIAQISSLSKNKHKSWEDLAYSYLICNLINLILAYSHLTLYIWALE